MKIKFSTLVNSAASVLLSVFFIFAPTTILFAANSVVTGGQNSEITGNTNSVVNGGKNSLVTGGSPTYLQNPLGDKAGSICQLVNLLLKAVMVIGIPIAVLFIVYAGFKFVVAQGSPGEISEARTNLLNVIIGIAIFLGASLIAEVILNTLKGLGVSGVGSC